MQRSRCIGAPRRVPAASGNPSVGTESSVSVSQKTKRMRPEREDKWQMAHGIKLSTPSLDEHGRKM